MVDPIGSNFPPSVQAVNKARSAAQAQKNERSEELSDEVSLSAEEQELAEAGRLAAESRELLVENRDETLTRSGQQLNKLL